MAFILLGKSKILNSFKLVNNELTYFIRICINIIFTRSSELKSATPRNITLCLSE